MRDLSTKHPHLFMYKRAERRNKAAYDKYLSEFDHIQDELNEDEAIFIDEQLSMEQKVELMDVSPIKDKYSNAKAICYGLIIAGIVIFLFSLISCVPPADDVQLQAKNDKYAAPTSQSNSTAWTPEVNSSSFQGIQHYVYKDFRQFSIVHYFTAGMHYQILRSTGGGISYINITLDSLQAARLQK